MTNEELENEARRRLNEASKIHPPGHYVYHVPHQPLTNNLAVEVMYCVLKEFDAYKRKVSDAMKPVVRGLERSPDGNINGFVPSLRPFILPDPIPTPEDVVAQALGLSPPGGIPAGIMAALAAAGYEITRKDGS